MDKIIENLAEELGQKTEYVHNVVALLDEGNTIPFIARYRKEMHGAMDDTTLRNLETRLQYLRNLAQKTQFIVITHRRGTMEASDVLYGVTMQEQGVSKLLRLDLNQMEQQLGIME